MQHFSKTLGIISSSTAAILTVTFGVFIVLNNPMVYFIVAFFLAITVIIVSICLKEFIVSEKKFLINIAIAFVVIYALLVTLVYYTQIAIVLKGTLESELLQIVSDFPGTVFFYLDMLGYCFLCLGTFFMAFAIKENKLLRGFLFAHSALFIPTFLLPFLPINFASSDSSTGPLILVLWVAIFAPVCFLIAWYFKGQETQR